MAMTLEDFINLAWKAIDQQPEGRKLMESSEREAQPVESIPPFDEVSFEAKREARLARSTPGPVKKTGVTRRENCPTCPISIVMHPYFDTNCQVSKRVLDLENQLRNLIAKLHLEKNFPAMRDHNTEEQIG